MKYTNNLLGYHQRRILAHLHINGPTTLMGLYHALSVNTATARYAVRQAIKQLIVRNYIKEENNKYEEIRTGLEKA